MKYGLTWLLFDLALLMVTALRIASVGMIGDGLTDARNTHAYGDV